MMIRRTGWIVLPTALWLLLAATSFAAPQDAAEEAQPAAKPKSDVLLEDNPLLTEPRTPQTLMDAVVLMIDLARPGRSPASPLGTRLKAVLQAPTSS